MKPRSLLCLFVWFATVFLLMPFFKTSAAPPTGGLWGQYSKMDNVTLLSEFETTEIENINFDNFDEDLLNRIGQKNYAEIYWKGAIYADNAGEYDFRFDVISSKIRFDIDDEALVNYQWGDRVVNDVYLSKGWHKIYIWNWIYNAPDSKMQFYWTPPGEIEEIVPANKLSYNFWSNSILTIPKSGKEKMDYVAAGVGARDKTDPAIEIDMPTDVLDEDVWLIWYNKDDDPNMIIVKNENTGTSATVTGTNLTTEFGSALEYPEVYANLPKGLIKDGGTGKLKLSFKKPASAPTADFRNGLGIIVPFKNPNPSAPEGKLSIRMIGGSGYHGASPVMVFPTDSAVNSDIRPLFFFSDGETKIFEPAKYRPNYLVMLSGKNAPPAVSATLKDLPGATMIVPEQNPLSSSNSDTWYPSYGREGQQVDVISSNYVPNYWNDTKDQYVDSPEGEIKPLSIPNDHTWIAFQYYGSNFPEDGVDGSGESGPVSGGGLFSTIGLDEYDLDVTASGNGKVASSPAGIDCPSDCYEKYDEGTAVILTATPNGTSSFISWGGDCSGANPVCTLIMDGHKSVTAQFTIPGICGSGSGGSYCSAPTNKCAVGIPVSETYDAATKTWTWRCSDNGDLSGVCSATRNCSIIENTP